MNTNLGREIKKLKDQKHRRCTARIHLYNGIRSLTKHPGRIIFLALILTLAAITWRYRANILVLAGISNPLLITIWLDAFSALIVVLTAFFLISVISWFGKPVKARKIEDDVKCAGVVDRYGNSPILISNEQDSKVITLMFYSPGISIDRWKDRKEMLVSTLGYYIDKIDAFTKNGHYCVKLVAVDVSAGKEGETLYDDEL